MFGKIIDNFLFGESNSEEDSGSIQSCLDEGYVYFTIPSEETEEVINTLHQNNLGPVECKSETILSHGMDDIGGQSQLLFYESIQSLKLAVSTIWEKDKSKVFAVYNGDWIINQDDQIETFLDNENYQFQ